MAHHHHLLQQGARRQGLLQGPGLDVFTAAEHDRVLGTAGEHQRTIRQQVTQITGVKPTLPIQHLGRGLGAMEIARHHLGALRQHQPGLAQGQGGAALGIHNPHGRSRQGLTGTAPAVAPGAAAGEHRAGFGEPVAHQQLNPNRLEKPIHVAGQSTAATDGRAQAAAHHLPPQFGPDHGPREPVPGPTAHRHEGGPQPTHQRFRREGEIQGLTAAAAEGQAVGQGPADQALAPSRQPSQGIVEAGEQRLPQARHADQIVGTHLLQIGAQLLEGGVGLPAATGQEEILGRPLIGMPDRQHAQHPIPGPGGHRHPQGAQLVEEVGVAEGYPLGLAGGAGGVQDRGQAMGIVAGGPQGAGLGTGFEQTGPAQAADPGQLRRAGFSLQQHHKAQPISVQRARLRQGRQQRR